MKQTKTAPFHSSFDVISINSTSNRYVEQDAIFNVLQYGMSMRVYIHFLKAKFDTPVQKKASYLINSEKQSLICSQTVYFIHYYDLKTMSGTYTLHFNEKYTENHHPHLSRCFISLGYILKNRVPFFSRVYLFYFGTLKYKTYINVKIK